LSSDDRLYLVFRRPGINQHALDVKIYASWVEAAIAATTMGSDARIMELSGQLIEPGRDGKYRRPK